MLVGEHHVVEVHLVERERVVVRLLERDEADRLRLRKRLDEVEQVLEADARPVHVVHRPAGDAVERRDLVGARQREQLVVGEAARLLDEPADLEPPTAGSKIGIEPEIV